MPTLQQTKARLLALNPTELNPALRRLQWIAERYPPDVVAMTASAFAEAIGRDQAARLLLEIVESPNTAAGVDAFTILAGMEMPEHTRFDRYLPWAARQFSELKRFYGDSWHAQDVAHTLASQFRAIVDWAEDERVDLNRYNADEALRAAEHWGLARVAKDMPQGTVVYRFADGWTVQELNEQDALDAEGDVMQHCLGSYESDRGEEQGRVWEFDPPMVLDGAGMFVRIFSLRDPRGMPHATMEFAEERDWHPGAPYVVQLRGKQNAAPTAEYLARMVEFRRAELSDWPVVAAEFPDHADGIGQPLVGAFQIEDAVGDETYLVYADGTVLDAVDVEAVVERVESEGKEYFADDQIALNEYVINTLDRVEPKDLAAPIEDVDWIYWAAWLANKGRAHISGSTDEMVRWLRGMGPIA